MLDAIKNFDYKKLPVQAQAILLVGVVSVVAALVQALKGSAANRRANAMIVVSTVIAVALSSYNAKCLVDGKCNLYASVVAGMYVLTQGFALLSIK